MSTAKTERRLRPSDAAADLRKWNNHVVKGANIAPPLAPLPSPIATDKNSLLLSLWRQSVGATAAPPENGTLFFSSRGQQVKA